MNDLIFDYRKMLRQEFECRLTQNASYSLRAFARDLQISPQKLSESLRGVGGFSSARARAIASRLGYDEKTTDLFVTLVEVEHCRSRKGRREAQEKLTSLMKDRGINEIELERFQIISDWYHFAILELANLDQFESDPKWIANQLGITELEAFDAVQRLLDFGYLIEENGRWKRQNAHVSTPNGIPFPALKMHHSQMINKAQKALFDCPIEERSVSSTSMAFDKKLMPKYKNIIKRFRKEVMELADADSREKNSVYCMSIQFFPLTPYRSDNNEPDNR